MISRIVLVITFISFLFSCTHNEKLLSFDKKNDNIILSPKLKGKILYIAEKKDNMEYQEDENIIIKGYFVKVLHILCLYQAMK